MKICCCVPSCPKPGNLACYSIPKDSATRRKWLSIINSDSNYPRLTISEQEEAAVCSLHFKQNDFNNDCHDQTSKREIKENSIPSIFPWTVDWESNFCQEIARNSNNFSSLDKLGLPDGEVVELGNVESLGIAYPSLPGTPESSRGDFNGMDTSRKTRSKPVKGGRVSTRKSSSDTSDEGPFNTSSFTLKLPYSCADCGFKSTNPIQLREHRIKDHSPKSESVKTTNNSTICETPKHEATFNTFKVCNPPNDESVVKTETTDTTELPFHRFFDKRIKKWRYNCKKCGAKWKTSLLAFDHDNRKHNGNHDLAKIPWRRGCSTPSDSSASRKIVGGHKRKARKPRNIYPCKKCQFQTPNARKLKLHYSSKHSLIVSTSSIRTPSPDVDSIILDLHRSNIKTGREHGTIYYYCPTCPNKSKTKRQIVEHLQLTHMSANPSPPASVEPKQEICANTETTDTETHQEEKQSGDEQIDSGENNTTRFNCPSCLFSTKKIYTMKSHEKQHKFKSGFQCHLCTYSINSERGLVAHLSFHHRGGFGCKCCEFKADTKRKLKSHVFSAHKPAAKAPEESEVVVQREEDVEIEHVCSYCNFRTCLRDQFITHEKTHLQDVGNSSTDELSIPSESNSEKYELEGLDLRLESSKPIKRKLEEKSKPSSNSANETKLVERSIYQCSYCSYWARSVTHFHQHLVAHEKSPAFKCSNCDFSARYRTKITRHIQKSLKSTHESARWIMIKSLPDDQYSKYLKKALVPMDDYSGTTFVQILAAVNAQSSGDNSSSESLVHTNDSDGSREWLPSSNASSGDVEDSCSSTPTFVMTPESSTDDKPSSPSFFLTSSETKSEVEEKTSRSDSSPIPTTSKRIKIEPKSPNQLARTPRKKKLRISSESDEESAQKKNVAAKETTQLNGENGIIALIELPKSINSMELEIVPQFPSIEDALDQRRKDEEKMIVKKQSIELMQSKLSAMQEADCQLDSELLQLVDRKKNMESRLTKLKTQKKKTELELRQHQCELLKLQVMSDDGEEQVDENAIAESNRLVAESEAKLEESNKEFKDVEEEFKIIERQVKEAEESRSGAAQLVDIIRSELADEETEFSCLKDQVATSNNTMKELVAKQRKHIAAQAAMHEAELKMAYDRARAKIREKERDWLNALNKYVEDEVLPMEVSLVDESAQVV